MALRTVHALSLLSLLLPLACRAPEATNASPLAVPVGTASTANDDPPPASAQLGPHVPGRQLRSATSVDGGFVAPPGWIEERRAFAGIWPSLPAIALQETWVARSTPSGITERVNTVCRTATWDAPLETVARGADPRVSALLARVASDGENRAADWAEDGVRVRFVETRQRLGHLGRGGPSPALTELFICVDGVEAPSVADAAHAFVLAVPSAAPALPLLELASVQVLVTELKRRHGGADETNLTLVLSDAAQARVAEWIVANGLATRHPSIPWAFDSTDAKRSFVFYPPRGENLVQLDGR